MQTLQTILSVDTLEVETLEFTPEEKKLFRHLEYHLNLPRSLCKFIIIANSLKDKSIYNIAVEMKKRNSFNLQNFYRMITKLRERNFIKIFQNEDKERFIEIKDPFIFTILAM